MEATKFKNVFLFLQSIVQHFPTTTLSCIVSEAWEIPKFSLHEPFICKYNGNQRDIDIKDN